MAKVEVCTLKDMRTDDVRYEVVVTGLPKDGWQTRRNEKKDCMEYYRKIEEE